MNCDEVRPQLLDFQHGRLATPLQEDVRGHLRTCLACAHEEVAEALLTGALEHRLPQHAAPLALKRRLAAQWPLPPRQRLSWWAQWGRAVIPAMAAAAVLLIAVPIYYEQAGVFHADRSAGMVTEAVTDHLRILASQHPLDVEGGNMHQAKPWFEGRLDFAPVVRFLGDQEFPLAGGAIGYFLDRKAAIFVFYRRLHTISLFVFRAEGVPWPAHDLEPVGPVKAYRTATRGFNVICWRAGELGYALVSDLEQAELTQLAAKL